MKREEGPSSRPKHSQYLEVSRWSMGFPDGSAGNTGDIRDMGSIPGLGRSPGGGNDNPLQYSCLKKIP